MVPIENELVCTECGEVYEDPHTRMDVEAVGREKDFLRPWKGPVTVQSTKHVTKPCDECGNNRYEVKGYIQR